MGTCCASRTDMTGKDKTGKTTGGKTDPGVKFNPMDTVRNTITQLLADSK